MKDPKAYVDGGWEQKPTGFTRIADVDWEHEPYQFEMTRIWVEDETGLLFYATDAGCSCPEPFEGTQVQDLWPITRMQDWYNHFQERVEERKNDSWKDGDFPANTLSEDSNARERIRAFLKVSR